MKFANCTTGKAGEFYHVNMDMVDYMTRLKGGVTRLTFVNGQKLDVAEAPPDIIAQVRTDR